MQAKMIVVIFALIALQNIVRAAVMPSYIQVCARNDPQLDECVKNSVHNLRPYLSDGIKELNVPAMEPLYIGDLNILEGGGSGITVKAKKLKIYGASNFVIKKMKSSNNGQRFDFELKLPRLQGEGGYNINGQLLALPIKGNGPFTGNFTNFYAFVKMEFEIKQVHDIDYVTIKDLSVKIRTGKGSIRLQNLFGGDSALGEVINETINQNFEVLTNEIIRPLQVALEKKFTSIARKILENFTYNELFPVKPVDSS